MGQKSQHVTRRTFLNELGMPWLSFARLGGGLVRVNSGKILKGKRERGGNLLVEIHREGLEEDTMGAVAGLEPLESCMGSIFPP